MSFDIPVNSWPAALKWMIAKNGIGTVFLALLIPLYLDFKENTKQYASLGEANVKAMVELAGQIREQRTASAVGMEAMKETIRRMDQGIQDIKDNSK